MIKKGAQICMEWLRKRRKKSKKILKGVKEAKSFQAQELYPSNEEIKDS